MAEKKKDPCWKGYTKVGSKTKGGKSVPNCVPSKGGRVAKSDPAKPKKKG